MIEIAAVGAQRPAVLEALEREFTLHKVWEEKDKVGALGEAAGRVRAVVTNAMAGASEAVMTGLPNLELCAVMGVGLERTNLIAAKANGVVVTTTPVLYDDVADLAVVLGMTACRRIAEGDRFVRSGKWLQGRIPPARKFSRKTRRDPGTRPDRDGARAPAGGVRHADRLLRSPPPSRACRTRLTIRRAT